MSDKEEKRQSHPGWAVRFEDGTWLGGAHGWFRTGDAFYADKYQTKEEAHAYLQSLRHDKTEQGHFDLPAEIIPAWEPMCESLRVEVASLKEANTITPSKLMDIAITLEGVLFDLKWKEKQDD
jgi:hypothetical protein